MTPRHDSNPLPAPRSNAVTLRTRDDGHTASGLIAGAAHDLRSPLTALLMNLHFLREALCEMGIDKDPRVAGVLEDGALALRTMEEIMDAMRTVAPRGDTHEVPVAPVLASLARLLRWDLARRGLRVSLSLDGEPTARGPAEQIVREVLDAVARASVGATRGTVLSIALSAEHGGELVVEVERETVWRGRWTERAA